MLTIRVKKYWHLTIAFELSDFFRDPVQVVERLATLGHAL